MVRRQTLPAPKVITTHLSRVSLISGTESGVQAPEGWQRAKLVLVLGAITALGPFTVDMYLSAFPFIANELSTSGELVQFTLTGSLLGFAVGQLIIGPLSDAFGRRVPLVAGSALHFGASLVCMIAPDIEMLTAARIVQGFGAAAGTVLALAVVRDLFDGDPAAIVLSRLMLVMGVAPILAPTIGGLLVSAASWRSIFLVLAVLGAVSVVLGLWALPETLHPGKRNRLRLRSVGLKYLGLASDPLFGRLVLVCGLGRMSMFSYIASSPFVLQNEFGLSAQQFGLFFACGAAILVVSSQVNVVLLRRWSAYVVLLGSLIFGTLVATVFTVVSAAGVGGLASFAAPVFLLLGVMGSVMPNAPAIALSDQADNAGTASALIGGFQFCCAAAAAPLVGVLGNDALATASMMCGSSVAALVLIVSLRCGRFLQGRRT